MPGIIRMQRWHVANSMNTVPVAPSMQGPNQMKIFRTKYIERPEIPIDLVHKCLARDLDGYPIHEAYQTVIASHIKTWQESAPSLIESHGKLAGTTGAIDALQQLADNLREIRDAGQKIDPD